MKRLAPFLLLLVALAVTILVYAAGSSGPFVLDDFHAIANNSRIAIQDLTPDSLMQAAFSLARDTPGRPVSMLSFALNHYFFGPAPYYFKLINLTIHLLNGVGVYFLSSLLLDAYRKRLQPDLTQSQIQWISLAIASAWLLHPLNLTGVLYAVQRMTSLSALFGIWGLVLFTWGRIRIYQGTGGIVAILLSLGAFTNLATLSKENGILLPFLFFLIEISFFNFETAKQSGRRFLNGFYIVTVALPILALVIYTAWHPTWISARYQTRNFVLPERLMTEGRVLWMYIKQILFPNPAQMGLYHDDIQISRGLFQPVSTIISLIALLGMTAVSVVLRKKVPLIFFGLFFFLIGHSLESSFLPLEIAYEHRNYLPMLGILFILCFYLLYPLGQLKNLRLRQIAIVLLIGLFAFNTYSRASQWSNPFDLAKAEVENHPDSLRANNEMANMYLQLATRNDVNRQEYASRARHYYGNMTRLDGDDIQGLLGLSMLNAFLGIPVEPQWITALTHKLQHAQTLPINVGKKLEGLLHCQMNKVCNFKATDLENLLDAPLYNPALTGVRRAMVYSARGFYFANLKQDYPAALASMQQAALTAPGEIAYRLTLASFLLALNRHTEAEEQLVAAKSLDKWGIHSDKIEQYAKLLSNLKQ